MEDHTFSLPLLATTTPSSSAAAASTAEDDGHNGIFLSKGGIISRFLMVILVGTISVWANHEASKFFKVTIINNHRKDSPAGQRFALFYESNDEATRIILNTSAVVENILYPPSADPADNQTKKKPVHHVILQLATGNLSSKVIVDTTRGKEFVYVISLSPSLMEETNAKHAVISAIQRAMARIWLWDGESTAPAWLIDGMVEYILMQAGFSTEGDEKSDPTLLLHNNIQGIQLTRPEQVCDVVSQLVCSSKTKPDGGDHCWELDKNDPRIVAGALGYLEEQRKGYVRELNQMLRRGLPCRHG